MYFIIYINNNSESEGIGTEILSAILKIITAIEARLKYEEADISERTFRATPLKLPKPRRRAPYEGTRYY